MEKDSRLKWWNWKNSSLASFFNAYLPFYTTGVSVEYS